MAGACQVLSLPFAQPDVAMELILKDPAYAKFHSAPKTRDAHIIMKGVR